MRFIYFMLMSILFVTQSLFAQDMTTTSCSIKDSMIPKCYHSSTKAELNIALVYYGDHWKMEDLQRIEPILQDRFFQATGNQVSLNIINKKVLPFKQRMPEGYQFKQIKDPKRLQRIWYYDNVGSGIMKEVYDQYTKTQSDGVLNKLDAIVAVTGAQFDGLGFASGRVSVTEQPREIAWNLEDGGRVQYVSDFQIVDELIHELGHNMFLGHTSTQCQKTGISYPERQACCKLSASKDDVLSYCRKRAKVNEDFMHKFESCNQDIIRELVIPAMISGSQWNIAKRKSCQ